MKKWFVVLLVVGILTAIFVPAYALTTTKNLTPDAQQDVDKLWQQMQDTRNQILQEYVKAGVITQEQADDAAGRMKERYELRKEQGIVPGSGMCGAGGAGNCGGGGCGMGGRGGFRGQSAPTETVY